MDVDDLAYMYVITGPPNGPVLFCLLSSVVVCNAAGGRAGRRARGRTAAVGWVFGRSGGRHCTAGQYDYVPLGRHFVKSRMIKGKRKGIFSEYMHLIGYGAI